MFEGCAPHTLWKILLEETRDKIWKFKHLGHIFEITKREDKVNIVIDRRLNLVAISPSLLLASAIRYCDFINYDGNLSEATLEGKEITERVIYRELFKLIVDPNLKREASKTRARNEFKTSLLKNRIKHLPVGGKLHNYIGKSAITIRRELETKLVLDADNDVRLKFDHFDYQCAILSRACHTPFPVFVEELIRFSSSLMLKLDGKWVKTRLSYKNTHDMALCIINDEKPTLFLLLGHYKMS